MNNKLTTTTQPAPLALVNDLMKQASKAANKATARAAFTLYQQDRPHNTNRRHKADLALFEDYLNSAGVPVSDLYTNPQAWAGIDGGIVEFYKEWQLQEGYALESINVRLSTVKRYAALAYQAGILSHDEHARIQIVKGFKYGDKPNIDNKRAAAGYDIRRTTKARLFQKDNSPRTRPHGWWNYGDRQS